MLWQGIEVEDISEPFLLITIHFKNRALATKTAPLSKGLAANDLIPETEEDSYVLGGEIEHLQVFL